MKIFHDSGDEEALRRLSSLFLRDGTTETVYRIEWMRMHKRTPIIKLNGIEDRSAAEGLIDKDVFALLAEARPDEDGAWLVSELVGLLVFDNEKGAEAIGRVISVISNPANDILEIEMDGGRRLLPFVDLFVPEVDIDEGRVLITPPEGWLE